ncbi:MAG TPA: carboxypeptidase regulatory-like domain-containing protein [Thermoanaerobaculia bacterium]|nr:carboxypeptidase regulatory-like domain-containing protein [Thermoanaerobaculia bacterium]
MATIRTVVMALAFAGSSVAAQDAPAIVRVRGMVVDSAGIPLVGAEVRPVGTELMVLTGDSGVFRVELPAGPVVFAVRRLGYQPSTFLATLRPGRTNGVLLVLTENVQGLPGVVVAEEREQSWLRVFNERSGNQPGTFITRTEIEKSRARLTTDLLRRRVPSAQVVMTRYGARVYMRGNSSRRCAPQLFVHSTPYSGEIDDFPPDVLEAMEVYSGSSEVPPELNIGRAMCGVIVIWTRDPKRSAGRG